MCEKCSPHHSVEWDHYITRRGAIAEGSSEKMQGRPAEKLNLVQWCCVSFSSY